MASSYLEAALRKNDVISIHAALTKFIEIKKEPHHRVLKLLGNMVHIPDELYVLVRKNFTRYGKMIDRVRSFEKPSFRPQADGQDKGKYSGIYKREQTGKKKFNPKHNPGKKLPYSTRKNLVM